MDATLSEQPEVIDLLSLKNPVFCSFIFWSSILVLKMLGMSPLTAFNRFRYKIYALFPESIQKRVFPNVEDTPLGRQRDLEVKFDDPQVERVRRAHRNDMENILPYFAVGVFYVACDPIPAIAVNFFRIASVARIVHTLVYAFYPVPQPSRLLAWLVHYAITGLMALHVLYFTMKYI